MTNKEKYGNEIIELAIDEGVLALKNGEPALCAEIKCEDCDFHKSNSCEESVYNFREWLNSEYVEPPVDWSRVAKATRVAIQALEEVKQYLAIGAPEECRAAVKQTAKKPIFNHNLSDTLSVFHCECGNTIKVSHDIGIMNNNNAPNYCSKCGCKLDWSDEE